MSDYRIKGETGEWEVVIGLEVHAQVTSNAKLFSGAATAFGAEPNTQVSLVDAAMPGMLPVINGECVKQAVRTGLALDAKINTWSRFDRKNYFYADLPQGYQISQFQHPIVGEGEIHIDLGEGRTKTVGLERIHLEQDAGKSMHDQSPRYSYVDLNRSGVALMEIVSRPDMRSPEEAGAYVKKLRSILRYVGSCDGNMEEGSMRADVNVSVRRPGDDLGTRCEVKNVNSVRFVQAAIEYEAQRQVEIIEGGGTIVQETRLFDPGRMETRSLRSKEDAHDYRYFPDPDLLPLVFDDAFVEARRAELPELPDAKRARYINDLGISVANTDVITAEIETVQLFEAHLKDAALKQGKPEKELAKQISNWIVSTVLGEANRRKLALTLENFKPSASTTIITLINNNVISGSAAKDVYTYYLDTGGDPEKIVEERGLKQVSDTGALDAAIADVLAKNADKVAEYKGGKEALFGFFVGQTMKATGGKANPKVVNELLKAALAQ
ncbi:Asp-tRNA(Asn)/Glu-tRNA(Gln) amidotransferase subunit GatB [Sphingosinicella sp.]|uniref:Asp-tRNA(Asn)/Glu-tRNA(Gln) amidotransferase subunit GatB n=1 Tax=Sphingosinicella sp. TaxID=1917971 RepID=UPI0035ADFA13